MDLPSDRAASGSFFEPNSTISTTAMMRTLIGLSNKSPIFISALFTGGRRVPALGHYRHEPTLGMPISARRAGLVPKRDRQAYCARAAAASSLTWAASAGGLMIRPFSPSRRASRRTQRLSGVDSVTRSRPSPSSVTSSHG